MKLDVKPKGYRSLGVAIHSDPLSRTVIVSLWKVELRFHRRNEEEYARLVEQVRRQKEPSR